MLKSIKNIVMKNSPAWLWKMLSFLKVMLFVSDAKGLKSIKFIKNKDQAIVLGNGPSLKNDIEKIAEVADDYDFICVNNFATSPYYKKFKPVTYIFLDSYFISNNVHPDWKKKREETFTSINTKTSWRMNIILPYNADEKVLEKFIVSKNIKVIKVKVFNVFFKKCGLIESFLMSTGLFGPSQNNVLIYAVYYGIWARYNTVEIFGADFTIYKNIDVDHNNKLIMKFSHFNSSNKYEKLMVGPLKDRMPSMAEMMFSAYRILMQHEVLKEYAVYKNVQIINKSSVSLIDAYDREFKNNEHN